MSQAGLREAAVAALVADGNELWADRCWETGAASGSDAPAQGALPFLLVTAGPQDPGQPWSGPNPTLDVNIYGPMSDWTVLDGLAERVRELLHEQVLTVPPEPPAPAPFEGPIAEPPQNQWHLRANAQPIGDRVDIDWEAFVRIQRFTCFGMRLADAKTYDPDPIYAMQWATYVAFGEQIQVNPAVWDIAQGPAVYWRLTAMPRVLQAADRLWGIAKFTGTISGWVLGPDRDTRALWTRKLGEWLAFGEHIVLSNNPPIPAFPMVTQANGDADPYSAAALQVDLSWWQRTPELWRADNNLPVVPPWAPLPDPDQPWPPQPKPDDPVPDLEQIVLEGGGAIATVPPGSPIPPDEGAAAP